MLPPNSAWEDNSWADHYPWVSEVPLRQSAFQSIRDMKTGDMVYKYGASTGYPSGTFHGYKPICRLSHDKYVDMEPSGEYVFIAHKEPELKNAPYIANKGDSGSVVFNKYGHIVGLLFTGQTPTNASKTGHALITPIEDVLDDIKLSFDGEIIDIRFSTW